MKPGIKREEPERRNRSEKGFAAVAAGALLAAFSCGAAWAADDAMAARMTTIAIDGGRTLKVVAVDLTDASLEVASYGAPKYGKRERFEELARRSGAVAAINGCYFDMKTGRLVGHVYHDGKREVAGAFSAAFAVGNDGRATIGLMKELGDPEKYKTIIACVDILMKNRKILVRTKADLVKNGHNPAHWNDIYRPARWTAIGIGSSGTVYLVVTPNRMKIYDFVKAVRERTEIVDLLGLDGGSSSGLYFRGEVVVRPARTIPSVIVARAAGLSKRMIAKGEVEEKDEMKLASLMK